MVGKFDFLKSVFIFLGRRLVWMTVFLSPAWVQADVFVVSSKGEAGLGSLRYAVAQANSNPGHDIIEIPAKFNRSSPISTGSAPIKYGEIEITDDITIRGLGDIEVVIDDHQKWVTPEGLINTGYPFDTGAVVLKEAGLLFRVNRNNVAGRKISVNIENLQITHFARVISSDNSDVVLNKVWLYSNKQQQKSDLQIVQDGGSLAIVDSLVFENTVFDDQQIILANSDLTISGSAFQSNRAGVQSFSNSRLLQMGPATLSSAVIRDSYFSGLNSTPFEFSNTNVEIINTVIDGRDSEPTRAIRVFNGDLTLTNSTLYYPPQTVNSFPALFQSTHIELLGSAQLIANNNLLLSVNAATNTQPVVFPSNWNDTGVYTRAVDSNNYISAVGGDDSSLKLNPLMFNGGDSFKGFVPNELSVPLVDAGDDTKAIYTSNGAPIIKDYAGQHRPQGGAIDIGALEKHETLYAHVDSYQTDEGISLSVNASNGVLANDTTPGGLDVTLNKQALHGQVTLNADGSFEYTPDSNYYGHDEFVYELSGLFAVVSIEVRSTGWLSIPNNIQPVAVSDSYDLHTTDVLTVDAPGVLLNDRDEINTSTPYYLNLTTRLYKEPEHGSLTLSDDGGFIYTPDEGYIGWDSFMYDAVDVGLMHSTPQTVNLNIKAGVSPGGSAKVATSLGSMSLIFLGLVLFLMLFKLGALLKILKTGIAFVLSVMILLAGNVMADPVTEDDDVKVSHHDVRVFAGVGFSELRPELEGTQWRNTKTTHPSFKIGASYAFSPSWVMNAGVYLFDTVNLKSNSVLYPNLEIDYRLFNVGASYYVWSLSSEYFVPFVSAGVSYIDPVIIGDESLVDVENEFSPSYGIGALISRTSSGSVDLYWQKMAGDINVLELTITLFFNN